MVTTFNTLPRQDVHALNSDSDGDSGPRPERTHVAGPYQLRYLDVNPCPAPAPVCAWMLTPQPPSHPLPRNTYRCTAAPRPRRPAKPPAQPVPARSTNPEGRLVHPGPEVPDTYTNPAHEPDSQTSECVAGDLLSIAVFAGDVGGEHAKLLDAFADEIPPTSTAASTDSRYSHFAWATSPVTRASLFIVNPKGIIRPIALNDLAFTDEHGEMCPANCSEGAKTIKPDPGSLKYFASVENGNGSKKSDRTD
ncbi:uncharacterized protein BXZ73DRAFT_99815 [Epithele typhae]|uniref:uncharacterized protein n=1 Tax=Epithele typhae TaxID=378194 RepID=UPI002007337D|nr:uncharacterized protein BXZ73DRAFT_99815 [Epithele typhae]KAH9938752.1 hypothetical protein BXZ73DRAFT_99815 [Epithele typhae]